MTRAAFLDRDGTLNVRPPLHEYLNRPEDFRWLPGAAEGAGRLAAAGFALFVVSNQRGLSRGITSWAAVRAIEERIQAGLEAHGARVTAFAYCPHGLDDGCRCRKPRPGLILDLAERYAIDLAASWMIGDAASDVEAGRRAGCRTGLVGGAEGDAAPDLVAPSLGTLTALIVDGPGGGADAVHPSAGRTTSWT